MNWRSTFGDEVAVGDEVALSLLGHPEARGLIVGATEDGRAVVSCAHCAGTPVTVEDFNLAALLRNGGGNRLCAGTMTTSAAD